MIRKSEDKAAKLQNFEQIIVNLITNILNKAVMEKDDFAALNTTECRDERFDDLYKLRNDLGEIINALCKCSGPKTIYTGIFNPRLQEAL